MIHNGSAEVPEEQGDIAVHHEGKRIREEEIDLCIRATWRLGRSC